MGVIQGNNGKSYMSCADESPLYSMHILSIHSRHSILVLNICHPPTSKSPKPTIPPSPFSREHARPLPHASLLLYGLPRLLLTLSLLLCILCSSLKPLHFSSGIVRHRMPKYSQILLITSTAHLA